MDEPHAHAHHHHAFLAAEQSTSMHMTFSFSSDCGPLLFTWWHPRSTLTYFLSLCIIFGLGAASESLATRVRTMSPSNLIVSAAPEEWDSDNEPATRPLKQPPVPSLVQTGALHAASIALNMAVMLLAMSFNVGVFVALVLGVAVARTSITTSGRSGEAAAARSGVELCH